MSRAIEQYLARYAEPEARIVIGGSYQHAVVIPAAGEGERVMRTLASLPNHGATLVVLVVNARVDARDEIHIENDRTLSALDREFVREDASGRYRAAHCDLVVIERTRRHRPFPSDQGVGLARKIGFDIMLAAYYAGSLRTPVVHTTDADAMVPRDYFTRIDRSEGASAWLYPFRHTVMEDVRLRDAVAHYEDSLRYYVDGLRRAGSPYAFHAIGSTMAIHIERYAEVRGVPRRNAAEDFYLLNKLRKVAPIRELDGSPIELEGRISDRVPFGTGQAVRDLLLGKPARFFYPPVAFDKLCQALAWSDRAIEDRECALPAHDPLLVAALQHVDLPRAVERARSASSRPQVVKRHLDSYFDAFQTMKFIHFVRDAVASSSPPA